MASASTIDQGLPEASPSAPAVNVTIPRQLNVMEGGESRILDLYLLRVICSSERCPLHHDCVACRPVSLSPSRHKSASDPPSAILILLVLAPMPAGFARRPKQIF